VPQPKTTRKSKPLYRTKAPKPPKERGIFAAETSHSKLADKAARASAEPVHYHPIAPTHFKLRDDGGIEVIDEAHAPEQLKSVPPSPPKLVHHDEPHGIWLYHGNSLELLDAIAAKYPEGRFDCIFADPPYFLSNGGISCHAGKMVKVDKGDWDKSRGPELNHEFNTEWLRRCQRVLKPNGTIWVSGTHHVIFSIGYAMQQLGFKILNDIAWEKPNPPPNLSCRYFTHSTETILWAAKNEKSKHVFNYKDMKAVTGKQMKTVWTMTAPRNSEKEQGKHPTQKPVALIERCLLASTNPGDTVLDPFLGGGTTAVACIRLKRACIGIELDGAHAKLATTRTDREIIILWLREFRVEVMITVEGMAGYTAGARTSDVGATEEGTCRRGKGPQRAERAGSSESHLFLFPPLTPDTPQYARPARTQIDLDLYGQNMDRISRVKDGEPKTECIFHETKFVFLSCASVSAASVVHTTVDVSLQEAWAKTPTGKLRETTHVVRCVTEILKVKST